MRNKTFYYIIPFMLISAAAFFLAPSSWAGGCGKVGVIMTDHSGPEYYPSTPSGNQCVACDEGQPYTDGFDHSADGYFAMKYFLGMLVNPQAVIPGFVADAFTLFGAGDQGIILMDRDNPSQIVDDIDYFPTPYTPTLIDAWGEEGIYVDPSLPGADPITGYITYTDLYMNFNDLDGTPLYIWPQPYPYPTGDPAYPTAKSAFNDGEVPFYLLPKDVMNSYEDTNFDGGTDHSLGYGPWSLPGTAQYLEGPIVETTGNYPDNGWQNLLSWNYDTTPGVDWQTGGWAETFLNAWNDRDFYEFVGFDAYTSWHRKGGREVYMEEVTGEMKQVKDWLWANYETTLTNGATGQNKDDYIKITYMIDPCYCDGVDPTDNIHGKSLYDAVYNMIGNGFDKIIMHDHFIQLSEMMNDDMGWRMINMAIMKANMDFGTSFSMADDMIFVPGHPWKGASLAASPYKSWYERFFIGTKDVRENVRCEGARSPIWSDELPKGGIPGPPYLVTKDMWVGGVAQRPEYITEVINKANTELNWAVSDGADDIAMFMSNHGTPTKNSWCFDSLNDYLHFNNKLSFILSVEAIINSPAFTSSFGSVVSKTYEPDSLTSAEILDLADQTDGDDIAILDKDVQICKIELSTGRRIAFYRVSGQEAFTSSDPGGLVFSPREAINDIMDVLNPDPNWNVTHIVDFLYNFMGQSGDLLWDQRVMGYGEGLEECDGGDPQACDEQTYLRDLALVYSNPIIDDATNPNSWKNYQAIPEQYCYPPAGNPFNPSDPCWDFGHDDPLCPNPVPEGCYVSLFTIYDDAGDPKYDPVNTPNGLKVKITQGDWGWDGKVAASRNMLAEALNQFCVPTLIELASFEAIPGNRKVTLVWTTKSEVDNIGFNIYRSTSEDGEYVKVNDVLIAANGEGTTGGTYSFTDKGLKNRTTYYYKLEDIDTGGTADTHGPVSAKPGVIAKLLSTVR